MRERKVVILYHSLTGNTEAAAELVAEGVKADTDLEVESHNLNEERVGPEILKTCAGVAFGSPDYFSYPAGTLKTFIDDWLIAKRGGNEEIEGVPVAMFLTHGGGGAGKKPFGELFRRVGRPVEEVLTIENKPEGEEAEKCRKLGRELGEEATDYLAELEA